MAGRLARARELLRRRLADHPQQPPAPLVAAVLAGRPSASALALAAAGASLPWRGLAAALLSACLLLTAALCAPLGGKGAAPPPSSPDDAIIAELRRHGAQIDTRAGRAVAARMHDERLRPEHLALLPRLRRLDAAGPCRHGGPAPVVAALVGLEELRRDGVGLYVDTVPSLARLPRLRVLRLRPSYVTDEALAGLAGCRRLEELELDVPPGWTAGAATAAALSRVPTLRRLALRGVEFDAGAVARLARLPRLVDLELTSRSGLTAAQVRAALPRARTRFAADPTPTPAAAMARLGAAGAEFRTDVISRETRATRVQSGRLVEADLPALRVLVHLREVSLEGLKLRRPSSLRVLSAIINLREASLRRLDADDACLAPLARLKGVERLALELAPGAAATGAALRHVAAMSGLREARLGGLPVGDADLDSFCPGQALTALVLSGKAVRVSRGAVGRLQRRRPYLAVEWPGGKSPAAREAPEAKLRRVAADIGLDNGLPGAPVVGLRLSTAAGDEGLALAALCPELTWLAAPGRVSGKGLAAIAGLRKLQWLELPRLQADDDALRRLAGLTRLLKLVLGLTPGSRVTDPGLEALRGMHRLEELRLGDTELTDVSLAGLGRLPLLRHLRLGDSRITEAGVARLRAARPGLEVIWPGEFTRNQLALRRRLSAKHGQFVNGPGGLAFHAGNDPPLTDDDLRMLKAFPGLREVDIVCATKLTEGCLAHLGRLKGLRSLSVEWKGRGDGRGFRHIAALAASLEVLELPHCHTATDVSLADVARLGRLRSLDLGTSRGVTDAGLANLPRLGKLESLVLRVPNVSDAGLRHLEQMKSLREVTVYGSAATAAGLARLRKALPGAKVSLVP